MKKLSLSSLLLALAAILATVLLAACGDDDSSDVDVGDLGADPASVAPADAPFYAEAVVRPEDDMLEQFNSTIGKLTGGQEPGALIQQGLDAKLAEEDLSYSEDIEPWLGARVGGFVTDFDPTTEEAEGALAIAVTDADAAQSFIDTARESGDATLTETTYNDVDYLVGDGTAIGIDGDFMVIGTEQGFKDAVDAADGDSLADNSEVSDSRADVPDNSVFSAYIDTQAVIDLVTSSGALTGEQLQQFEEQVAQYSEGPVNLWAVAADDAITFAGSAPVPTDAPAPSDLVSTFPSDAWFAFAAADVGAQLQTSLDQFKQNFETGFELGDAGDVPGLSAPDVDPIGEVEDATGLDLSRDLSWIGDAGGFVQGTDLLGLGGALVLEATDEEAAAKTVVKLGAVLGRQGVDVQRTDSGFGITIPGAPVGAEVGVQDGKLIAAGGGVTIDDVLSPGDTLEGSDRFGAATDALGEGITPAFYLDFLPVLGLIEASGQATSDPGFQAALPYLDALDYFVAGSSIDGDRGTFSVVLGVREAPDDSETAAATITP